MRETFEKNDCGRAAQVIDHLYGESDAAERADFERHLHDCAACRDELAAYTHVRGSVAEFRDELLRAAPPVSLASFAVGAAGAEARPTITAHAPHASPPAGPGSPAARAGFAPPPATPHAPARAAWAALREFFRLSPAWLRASTAAAALALCALALLAVVNAEVSLGDSRFALRTGMRPAAAPNPDATAATTPAQSGESAALQARLKSLAAERDAAVRELEETRAELDDSRTANLVAAEFETGPAAERDSTATRDERRQRRAPSAASKSGKPPRAARRAAEDEDLPRLLDLLGDAN